MTIIEKPKTELTELWNKGSMLACPKTRGHPILGYVWVHNGEEDPCVSGDCKHILCHSFKKHWDIYPELWIIKKSSIQDCIVGKREMDDSCELCIKGRVAKCREKGELT